MGLFGKKKEGAIAKTEDEKKEAKEKTPSVGAGGKKAEAPAKGFSKTASEVLVEPWITEKSHEKMAESKYIFRVINKAGKGGIAKAIEELYKVTVVKVNIINIPAKRRNFDSRSGWKSGYKKAIVTLKKGDKIELFEGV